ncbi:hypothetical protein RM531_00605 [Salinisphaera sp. P385]|uniref:Uncharacterized protein n=1 Tax=Spectribacter acetivorans TaxID=3075603 RepID=A0ABU3B6N7_9GAMM|nr:hypothetical protein [Salinisphaera sp. P385]MDT0616963.1 hypothetical protein [Salinisphaera sp. P385]
MAGSGERRGRRRKPLRVEVSLVVRTGPEPEDRLTILDDAPVPMVGSVFEYRNRIVRFFAATLVQVAMRSPAFYREIAPGLLTYLDALRGRGGSR